eukprot:CAMPEP_0206449376 /NCGR_PEP_ID=MMETSP0324_2-20121206/18052_1 /ASSEMBLY_ACC=CAM_ASM_000836 /TAXON_ID=2866 /ORGANISM="Crypthecodinium cohnii, Strain Seligo" /LENGTH=449 /DNA_ID=CAMNT_0053918741 /DNA_START=67 /DNA_END=1417 /DNA_ORIENTATION=-
MVKSRERSARGSGLKFSVKVLQTVKNFTPYTPIQYGPNPKQKGSKSFDRYNGYKDAKTVGEALHMGSKVADLCWELQRGDYKVLSAAKMPKKLRNMTDKDIKKTEALLKTMRGPIGLAVSLDDKDAEKELAKEEAWMEKKVKLTREYAAKLGVELELESHDNLAEEGIYENADCRNGRLVADTLATKILADRAKERKSVTEADVLEVLRLWGFAQNGNRLNVLPGARKWVYSDTLGAIQRRTGGYGVTPPTKRYPNVAKLLNQYLADNRPEGLDEDFVCSSININANYGARIHRDGNNIGPSAIRAFGDFKGGELWYWDKDDRKAKLEDLPRSQARKMNLKKKTLIFDGTLAHSVDPFEGERISVVWFSCRHHNRVGVSNVSFLKSKAGFRWPKDKTIAKLKSFAHNQFVKKKELDLGPAPAEQSWEECEGFNHPPWFTVSLGEVASVA